MKKPDIKKALPKSSLPVSKKIATPSKKSLPVKKGAKPVATKPVVSKKIATPSKKSLPSKPILKQKPVPKPSINIKPSNNKSVAPPKNAEIKAPLKSIPKAKDIKVPAPKPPVLPKLTATAARKYEPEFTKSVLDQPPHENSGPTMRYSDTELNEFRELIQRKLETAKKELGYLQGLITRKDEMGGDDTDNRYMTMEDGSLSMEREQLSQMASRQITFIDHLEKAMMRIENKTYGICRVTGKLIDKARLRAVPHATLSIEAKMGISK